MAILFINEETLLKGTASASTRRGKGGNTKKEPFIFYAIKVWELTVYMLCALLLPVSVGCLLAKWLTSKMHQIFRRK